MKKENYLKWDEYFMGIALLSAERSKDPNTSVDAFIVSQDNKILCVGFNGMPIGCSDDEFSCSRVGEPTITKYLHGCQSEIQAVPNTQGTATRGSLTTHTLYPCNQ